MCDHQPEIHNATHPPWQGAFTQATYAHASERAHTVLGMVLLCVLLVWAAPFALTRAGEDGPTARLLSNCYLAAGTLTITGGIYLDLWTFYLSSPNAAAFAAADVVQSRLHEYAASQTCTAIAHH